jgi:hypothetical protein
MKLHIYHDQLPRRSAPFECLTELDIPGVHQQLLSNTYIIGGISGPDFEDHLASSGKVPLESLSSELGLKGSQ